MKYTNQFPVDCLAVTAANSRKTLTFGGKFGLIIVLKLTTAALMVDVDVSVNS